MMQECAWCPNPAVEYVLVARARYSLRKVEKDGVKTTAHVCTAPERRSPACQDHADLYRVGIDEAEERERQERARRTAEAKEWAARQERLI